jgi:hypothetical protein
MKRKLKINGIIALLSLVVFVLFTATVLPAEAARSFDLGLVESIDTSFFYSATRLYEIIESYSYEVRLRYIYQRFSFDLVWPLVYGFFIISSTWYLIKDLNFKFKNTIKYLPIIAVIFDFLENILVSLLMYLYPIQINLLGWVASFFTSLKWITLSSSFILIIVLVLIKGFNLFYRKLRQL